MRNTPKLTITIPAYKGRVELARALTALSNQTFQDFTIVILNDRSPEPYTDIITTFSDQLTIQEATNPKNLGAMENIWQSIQFQCNTPYIMSHHQDDFLKSDYLERAIALLENYQRISFVLTGPEWVARDQKYTKAATGSNKYDIFIAGEFAYNVLHFAPYMFGSVVYRRSALVDSWEYETYNTYCDRFFLGSMLEKNKSTGAYLYGNGIYECDHTKDESDNRSPTLTEDNAIALLAFYKNLLTPQYQKHVVQKIITNNILYYFSNFPIRSSLHVFYQKQKPHDLIHWSSTRLLGLYAMYKLTFKKHV